MRNLFIAAILFTSLEIYTQDYVPFPTDSVAWAEEHTIADSGTITDIFRVMYYLSGDTIVEGNIYSKLYRTEIGEPFDQNNSDDAELICGIREENKRVYYNTFFEDENCEFLLFDFNLTVGEGYDLYSSSCQSPNSIYVTLLDIGFVELQNGEIRKVYYYDYLSNIIEGIGADFGYYEGTLLTPQLGLDYQSELMCFTSADSLYFSWTDNNAQYTSAQECLDINTILSAHKHSHQLLNVFPNPTNRSTIIALPRHEPTNIFVHDLQGKLIKELQTNSQEVQIELPQEQGVYLIHAVGESFSSVVKVLKE